MSLPERTLCWVEGPPWDRHCTPVEKMTAADLADAAEALRAQLPPMPELEQAYQRRPRIESYLRVSSEYAKNAWSALEKIDSDGTNHYNHDRCEYAPDPRSA